MESSKNYRSNYKKISSKCRIKSGVNFSSDGIISVIMRENLIFNQHTTLV